LKRIIMAGALAAAIFPLMAVGAAGAATSLPPGPAIYPGNGSLEHVTALTPAEIYTPWGVITDEYGTGATVPEQWGGARNGKPIPYPGWTTTSAPHVQLNFAILTTPNGEEVVRNVVNAERSWSQYSPGVDYPTCMVFTVAATSKTNYMLWSGGSWVDAPGCVLPVK
jgi:hypothetical protein